jgi:hypothetical protein
MTTGPWHADPLVDKARAMYFRAFARSGMDVTMIVEPIATDSGRDDDMIVLRNGSAVLVRFRIRPDGVRLRLLDEKRVRKRARRTEASAVDPAAGA